MSFEIATLLGFGLMLATSIIVGGKSARKSPSLLSYYWANRSLGVSTSSQLLLSTSFSLNGLLYHTWLGYKIGMYSVIIQSLWCAGYVYLAFNADRAAKISCRDNLHGNLSISFQKSTGSLAAIATIFGFASLAGWEFTIIGSIINDIHSVDASQVIWLALMIAMIVSAYTIRGGIRGNAYANIIQNIIAFVAIVVLSVSVLVSGSSSAAFDSNSLFKFTKLDENPFIVLGGIGFLANCYFSLVWQLADATNWQAMSSTSGGSQSIRKSLLWSSVLIVIAPGVIGTMLGLALNGTTDINPNNILSRAIEVAELPIWLVVLVAAGLCGAALSTLDGLLIASANAFTWDLYKKDASRVILTKEIRGQPLTLDEQDQEADILSKSYIFIFGLAILASLVVTFIGQDVPTFYIVYFAVIGQMALVPCTFIMVRAGGRALDNNASLSIAVGLATGLGAFLFAILILEGANRDNFLTYLPVLTSVSAACGLLVRRSRR